MKEFTVEQLYKKIINSDVLLDNINGTIEIGLDYIEYFYDGILKTNGINMEHHLEKIYLKDSKQIKKFIKSLKQKNEFEISFPEYSDSYLRFQIY